jgi:CubicO group peptidase (beta-lactamase class C family)
MDAAKLQDAVDYAMTQASYAIRIYRHGCLVAADRTEASTTGSRYESWSMAKSVTALAFGRAMTMGLISPDDPVGSLISEADEAHGAITLRDLLTMTGGMHWNGARDYNITMEDRLRDFLTVGLDHEPGTFFEYSQTGPFTVAEAVTRAVGEDVQAFLQRELFDALGIAPGAWSWGRDGKGRTQGFFNVQMTPGDYGRLGDLMRRDGVWNGRRLLSRAFLRGALTPSRTNGCYGWLIWLNAAKPCIGPTVSERGIRDDRAFPGLPADLYRFSGLFGQLVSVFPTQDLVMVRTGQDPGLVNPGGGAGWEETLYTKILGAITDVEIAPPGEPPSVPGDNGQPNPPKGFQNSFPAFGEWSKPIAQTDPVPAAGPFRQRALFVRRAVLRGKHVKVRVRCPPVVVRPCSGVASLSRARRPVHFAIAAGKWRVLTFALRPTKRPRVRFVAVNGDDTGGTRASAVFDL